MLLHPYSSAPLDLVEDVLEHEAEMVPAGEAEVLDLTVAEASHYVAWGGIISANCAFDELQTFAEVQFRYLYTRLRQNQLTSENPIPTRMRGSATPGGLHHEWVLARYSPWIRAHDPLWKGARAEDGARLYYRYDERKGEQVICDARDEGARSRAYFASEMLEEVGDEYRQGLDELDPLTREQRKFGNWLIRPGAGLFFKSTSFVYVDHGCVRARARVRGWDLAATPKKATEAEGKGAATAGVLMAVDMNGDVWVEHVARDWLKPDEVERFIFDTSTDDDREHEDQGPVLVDIPLDPGQAGIHQKHAYGRTFEGRYWRMTPEVGAKENRIKPLSARAAMSPIRIVRGDWNDAFTKELIAFPYGLKDQGDAASRAYASCLRMPSLVPSRDGSRREDRPARERRPLAGGFGRY